LIRKTPTAIPRTIPKSVKTPVPRSPAVSGGKTRILSVKPQTSSVATTSPLLVSFTGYLEMDDYAFRPPMATTTSPFVTIILHNYDTSTDYIIGYAPVQSTGEFTYSTTTVVADGAYNAIFGINSPGIYNRVSTSFVVGSTTLPQKAVNAIWDTSTLTGFAGVVEAS